jgi:hypothetical protein
MDFAFGEISTGADVTLTARLLQVVRADHRTRI